MLSVTMYVCLSPILNLGSAEVFRSAQYLNPSKRNCTYAKHAENKLKCNICFCCICRQSICILMNDFNVQLQCYMFRYPFKYLMVCRQKEKYQILPKLSFKSKHTLDFMFLKQFILLTTLGTSWEPAWMAVLKKRLMFNNVLLHTLFFAIALSGPEKPSGVLLFGCSAGM